MSVEQRPLRVLHISQSDSRGGAARAAYRLHRGLLDAGVKSTMWVDHKASGDPTVQGPNGFIGKAAAQLRRPIGRQWTRLLKTGSTVRHSVAVLPSALVRKINRSDADVVNLHWVNYEMLSVRGVARIRKPLVWTFHDMWPICGAEHHTDDERWLEGYRKENRPSDESGFDLNRWTWERKKRYWVKPIQIVTPSRWLANCVECSALMNSWPVTVIPNYLDLEKWRPIDSVPARGIAGLPVGKKLLLFGAIGGGSSPKLKGFDLLQQALEILRWQTSCRNSVELVVLGEHKPLEDRCLPFPVHYMGSMSDDISLRILMSAVDAVVIPSRRENFPNVAVEAIACNTPVAAFDVGGIGEIVVSGKTGKLASPGSAESLACAIMTVLDIGAPDKGSLSRILGSVSDYQKCYEGVLRRSGSV